MVRMDDTQVLNSFLTKKELVACLMCFEYRRRTQREGSLYTNGGTSGCKHRLGRNLELLSGTI